MRFVRNVAMRPGIWLGILFISIGLCAWIIALSEGDLSIVYPMGSIQYVITLFAAHFLLGEKIDSMKAIGTVLVVLGIIFVTMS